MLISDLSRGGVERQLIARVSQLLAACITVSVLRTLAASVDGGSEWERVWVTEVAGAVLPKDMAIDAITSAIERLRRYDVKDMAVDNLLKVDREAARYLLAWYRQRIAKEDYTNHAYALWVLARLDDRDAIPAVDRLIRREDIPPYLRYIAEVIRLLLAQPFQILSLRSAGPTTNWVC